MLEKPFTVTVDEAVEVMRAEKKSGKILTIGFQPRMSVNMKRIKQIVDSGELGKIYYIQSGGGRRVGIPTPTAPPSSTRRPAASALWATSAATPWTCC